MPVWPNNTAYPLLRPRLLHSYSPNFSSPTQLEGIVHNMSHTSKSRVSAMSPPSATPSSHRRYSSVPSQPPSSHPSMKPQQQRHSDDNTNANSQEEKRHHHHHHHHSSQASRHHHRHHRRSTRVQPDLIDQLDNIDGGLYHHEGPYDAACRERNASAKRSPIDALKVTNEEALKATPREKIMDSVTKRRPLDGVAYFPPGSTDSNGQVYNYEEGYNMMTEDRGNFRRWPGTKFRDEDFQNDPYYQRLRADLDADASKRRSWGLRRPRRPSSYA